LGSRDQEDYSLKQARGKVPKTLFWKYPIQKRAGRVARVVEHLPSKHEAMSSKKKKPL
jgi:hypothetical protein